MATRDDAVTVVTVTATGGTGTATATATGRVGDGSIEQTCNSRVL
jgi:hypothetical protein